MPILIALLLIPLAEVAIFILVGREIGVVATLLSLLAAGLLGALLLRMQGFATLQRFRQRLSGGEPPIREMFDAACLAVAGLLLILPGFLSDILALLALIPLVRRLVYHWLTASLMPRGGAGMPSDGGPGRVIEGEWRELDSGSPDDRLTQRPTHRDDGPLPPPR